MQEKNHIKDWFHADVLAGGYLAIRAIERGVSVQCQGQIFLSFGCQLENHSIECRLGMLTIYSIFHAAIFFGRWVSSIGVNFGCQMSGVFCP